MFRGTFEHGYADAIHNRQRVLGSDAYRAGYDRGVRYRKSEKALELAALGILAIVVSVALLIWITTPGVVTR
ncbi:Hypothetical protein NGAL_HAMBI2605_38180 [Neorhizobium galegae bv. orientalis]|nr:Hypothetical protein NGAL_HAMBI2605_38180 [Neorhizobium galegae bv. orientalis]